MTVNVDLTRGYIARVDESDLDLVARVKWRSLIHTRRDGSKRIYAVSTGPRSDGRPELRMHRVIMGNPDCDVDHRDGDGLNNSRSNLRLASRSQNTFNSVNRNGGTSQYRGVSWCSARGLWVAHICIQGKRKYLGGFEDEQDARNAYVEAGDSLFGEFLPSKPMPQEET